MKLIKSTFEINRPMIFLCGPYYEDKSYDRRKILKDYLIEQKKVIPIIVDKFLDKKNIKDNSVNIDMLEEICAAVSLKTYIFLDTFSSVAELGMFCARAYQNRIDVLIPKNTDIISNNIGFFIREIINNNNNNAIQCLHYRPKIVRVPLASDYVTEFYEFIENELPQNIKDRIMNDEVYNLKKYTLTFANISNYNEDSGVIGYHLDNSNISFTISLRILFYIVASLLLDNISLTENEIVEELKGLLKNSFKKESDEDIDEVCINTKINHDINEVVKHIKVFLNLYSIYGDYKGRHIITKQDSLIRDPSTFEYIGLSSSDEEIINNYIFSPGNFIETFKIKRGKKVREVIRYNDNKDGNHLRRLHELILKQFESIYTFSDNSFAYRKGYSVLDCISIHKKSKAFLKIDIKNFFNSIKYKNLLEYSKNVASSIFTIDNDFKKILKVCTYNNKLPLGLITSPILSDLYLHSFDNNIQKILYKYHKKIIFTRYADDMFFSSEENMNKDDLEFLISSITEELSKVELQINEEKTIYKELIEPGDHIKILGLNIVKTKLENQLTVGKKFINDTCKIYLDYLNKKYSGDNYEEYRFYTEKKIAGRLAYIEYAEGLIGINKLINRIQKSIGKDVNAQQDKNEWKIVKRLLQDSINKKDLKDNK